MPMSKKRFYTSLISILLAINICIFIAISFALPDFDSLMYEIAGALIFLPLEIIVVIIIVDRILSKRDIEQKLNKLNVVAGAFFSETGNPIMNSFISAIDNRIDVFNSVGIKPNWTKKDFKNAIVMPSAKFGNVDINKIDLKRLHKSLEEDRSFLIALLANPTLLEHERFTDMMLSVFHLAEELKSRTSLDGLPKEDLEHISIDINRAYHKLVVEWLDYMYHVRSDYPFLYSCFLAS